MLEYCIYSTVQYCTVLHSTAQNCTDCTVLYSTVQYCTILYSTVQYWTTNSEQKFLNKNFWAKISEQKILNKNFCSEIFVQKLLLRKFCPEFFVQKMLLRFHGIMLIPWNSMEYKGGQVSVKGDQVSAWGRSEPPFHPTFRLHCLHNAFVNAVFRAARRGQVV